MQDSETTDDQPQPALLPLGHETVIKFVLSGPILADHVLDAQVVAPEPGEEALALRARIAALERAVAHADARLAALSKALAVAVASGGDLAQQRTADGSAPTVVVALDAVASQDRMTSMPPPAAIAAGGDRGLAVVTTNVRPGEPELLSVSAPEPDQPDGAPVPKARGLRRMISVLKHD